MKSENKHYPDSLLNLRISYVVLVIEFKEIKQNQTTAGLRKNRRDWYAEIRDNLFSLRKTERQIELQYI